MELSVAVDDFERFILENKRGWERIETALDKIIDDHSTKNDITFQVKSNLERPIYRGGIAEKITCYIAYICSLLKYKKISIDVIRCFNKISNIKIYYL